MKKLLVVVDYQNDFVDGSLGFHEAAALDKIIVKKIETYRNEGNDVVFTFDTHDESYLNTQEGRKLPVTHCKKGSFGWELFGETGQAKNDSLSFEKNTFGSADLFDWLRKKPYDCVELCGLVINICVISNAVLAKTALPQAEIIVDATACAGPDNDIMQKTLDVLEGLQITVFNR